MQTQSEEADTIKYTYIYSHCEFNLTGTDKETFSDTTIKKGYNEVNFFSYTVMQAQCEEAETVKYSYSHCELNLTGTEKEAFSDIAIKEGFRDTVR